MKRKHNRNISLFAGIILAALFEITVLLSPAHALLILDGCVGAGSCTMTELVGGASITIDDKVFDNWSFSGSISSNLINVEPLGEGGPADPGQGLLFTGPGVLSEGSYDFEMNYDVSNKDGLETLHDYTFTIAFDQIVGNAGGFAATEVVNISSGNEIACGGVFPCSEPVYDQNNPTKSALFTDEITGLPVNSKDINVNTNVLVSAGPNESFASLTIEQWFSQVPPPVGVPEPSTMLLLGSGLAGLGLVRRKFKG